MSADAGADADLLSLFNKDAQVSLFSKNFDLFKKCFGSGASRRAYAGREERENVLAKRLSLSCPSSALGTAESVVEAQVPAASIAAGTA